MFADGPGTAARSAPARTLRRLLPRRLTIRQVKDRLKPIADPLRYRLMVHFQRRENRVYTQFHRFPNQYRVLTDKLIPALMRRDPSLPERPLRIAVFACCSGEEVVTLAHCLRTRFPQLKLHIQGYDIVSDVVERARTACYAKEEVLAGPFVTDDFIEAVFDRHGDSYRVKPALREGVHFDVGDITDSTFMARHEPYDLVFAQNVLFHLPRPVARQAFQNLTGVMRPGGALFVSGMDSDMRVRLTRTARLTPVEDRIEEIHDDARVDRGTSWAHQYWGREPFSRRSSDWVRKFSTIFIAED